MQPQSCSLSRVLFGTKDKDDAYHNQTVSASVCGPHFPRFHHIQWAVSEPCLLQIGGIKRVWCLVCRRNHLLDDDEMSAELARTSVQGLKPIWTAVTGEDGLPPAPIESRAGKVLKVGSVY